MCPLLLSLSHLDSPRSNLSLPLPSLSPCGALGLGDGDHQNLDPEVSSPPLPSPLSLPPLSPCAPPSSLPCARASLCGGAATRPAPPLPRPARARPLPSGPRRRSAPPLPSLSGAAPPLPSPAALGPAPHLSRPTRPLLSPLRRRSARPCCPAPWRVPARARGSGPCARPF
jgi:hypothetical protein